MTQTSVISKKKVSWIIPLLIVILLCFVRMYYELNQLFKRSINHDIHELKQIHDSVYSVNDKSIFVCITGHLSRLELRNKIEHLFLPLHSRGYAIDIGLALSDDYPSSVAKGGNIFLLRSVEQVIDELQKVKGVRTIEHRQYISRLTSKVRNVRALYQTKSAAKRVRKKSNTFDEYKALKYCDNMSTLASGGISVKIKEHAFIQSLDIDYLLRQLRENNTVVTSSCGAWSGYSDMLVFAHSSHSPGIFSAPYEKYLKFDKHSIAKTVLSDQAFKAAYRRRGFGVVNTSKILVTKALTRYNGEDHHVEFNNCTVRGMVMQKRNTDMCPLDNTEQLSYYSPCWREYFPHKVNDLEKVHQRHESSAYVCITGQLSRLEIRNKIEFLLTPLHLRGYAINIGLAISTFDSNEPRKDSSPFTLQKSIADVIHDLEKVSGVKRILHFPPSFKNLTLNPKFDNFVDNIVGSNARQFKVLQSCNNWPNIHNETDIVVRVRDDTLIHKIDFGHILRLVAGGAVVTSRCDQYEGVSDKIIFSQSTRASDIFLSPYEEYTLFDNSKHNISHLHVQSLYKVAYSSLGLDLKTSQLLLVTEMITNSSSGKILASGNNNGQNKCTVHAPIRSTLTKYCPSTSLRAYSYDTDCWKA